MLINFRDKNVQGWFVPGSWFIKVIEWQRGEVNVLELKFIVTHSSTRNDRHGMLCRTTWGKHQSWSGGRRRKQRKAQVIAFIGVSVGKASLGLASLNNSDGFRGRWALGQKTCPLLFGVWLWVDLGLEKYCLGVWELVKLVVWEVGSVLVGLHIKYILAGKLFLISKY